MSLAAAHSGQDIPYNLWLKLADLFDSLPYTVETL